MLRAWKGSDRYEPRAQLGASLRTIATNVCLSAIARRRSHPVELSEDIDHLQPYPDRLLDDLVARETVEPAFITAIQLLPPKQRAVLILRDVLGWSAKKVAKALEDWVAAVTSALQRPRRRLEGHIGTAPARTGGSVRSSNGSWPRGTQSTSVVLLTRTRS
jgi:RNA polymerase sigma-70 factor, ECF subfamily